MKQFKTLQALFFMLFILFFALNNKAQEYECLECHENVVKNTAHDKIIKCGDCHKDVKDDSHPETGAKNVDCGQCHKSFANQMKDDIHHKLNKIDNNKIPSCKTCHGTHAIQNPSLIKNNAKTYCGSCHKNNVMLSPFHTNKEVNSGCIECHKKKNYTSQLAFSIHSKLTCSNCHGAIVNNLEGHTKDTMAIAKADCYLCHNLIAATHKESIHGISLSEGINESAQCWNCHGSHDIKAISCDSCTVAKKNLTETCGQCHDDPDFAKRHRFSIKKPGVLYTQSIHGVLASSGNKNAPTCITCHGVHDIKNRIQQDSKISSVNIPNTCEKCHEKITKEYKQSIHWIGVKKGVRESPSCNDCHSEHNIGAINAKDKRKVMKLIQDKTCMECHQNLLLSDRYGLDGVNASKYEDSYHGLASNRGDTKAALCVDCHNIHKILPKDNPESSINENNLLNTCKRCHTNATEVFSKSYSHVSSEKDSAAFIENLVSKIYIWLIIIVIGGMLIHNLLIFIHDLREKRKVNKNEIKISRFTKNELIQHTVLLTSFLMLAVSGFLLKFPDSWWAEILYKIGITEVFRQYVHRICAVVMIILSVYHLIYLFSTPRGRSVLRSLLPNKSDIITAKQNVLYYLHLSKKHPEFDNYNYIEKAEYWALIWGTIIMGITGLVLWFPTVVGNWAPVWFIKVSEIIHYYEAILATLAIIVWHWFFVIFRAKEYPISFTSIDGQMTVEHYKDEHKMSFKKIVKEWSELKSGKRTSSQLSNLTFLFIESLKKNGIDSDEFIQAEIDKDDSLKAFIAE